jgi:6-hydroxynicotinate reductase
MILVDPERCTGCRLCAQECPTSALRMEDRRAVLGEGCARCGLCVKLCPRKALSDVAADEARVTCSHCPVECEVLDGFTGACKRYRNTAGELVLDVPLLVPAEAGPRHAMVLDPLVTGVGAGTTSPCFAPAPYIVTDRFGDVDVVTVVSEVPFSYAGLKVKIDTNTFIGREGAPVRRDGRLVGRVTTEEYGSKMLALGGVNILHEKSGSTAARTMTQLCNRETVEIKIEGGARLSLRVGESPLVDGVVPERMRVGCGSATLAMFAPYLAAVADEAIVLDPDITGLLTEHLAGRALGLAPSGIVPIGTKSTIGRYFGTAGPGLGGTNVVDARDAVAAVDRSVARPGLTLFVTDTAGDTAFLFRLTEGGEFEELPLNEAAVRAVAVVRENAEESRVSALFIAGAGGSARSGVSRFPIKLNRAVHAGEVRLTVGGAETFLLPGGGLTFMVDVERLPLGAVGWIPTPAMLAPIEYTMTREIYERIEGHLAALRPRRLVLAEARAQLFSSSPPPSTD